MSSSRDQEIIELWLAKQSSPHTRSCYQRDVARILSCSAKSLKDITLADIQRFARSLEDTGLAPISRARTLAAVKSLFGFCQRIRYIVSNPAAELVLPSYENRLSERMVGELEVRRLLETAEGARDRVLLGLLYAAGLRVHANELFPITRLRDRDFFEPSTEGGPNAVKRKDRIFTPPEAPYAG